MLKNSVQDKIVLDNSYLEYDIFNLIKTDLSELIKIKASLAKNFHIQPSEVDKLSVWEYELFMKHLNNLIKEDNDQQKHESDRYNMDKYTKMASPSNISKMTKSAIPNMNIPKL